jgi:CheY-like chemotaxis protein
MNQTRLDLAERDGSRLAGFQNLMRDQVRNILFVSSLYESFIMAEDGQLDELILTKFLDLNLSRAPNITRVSQGSEALALARSRPFDLIITSTRVGDMHALELARAVKASDLKIPVVLLAYDHQELTGFMARNDVSDLERIFVWQGDARILLAIVKSVEDRMNVEHDSEFGVPIFIVVEDNVRFYSSFLPTIYSEVMKLSQSVCAEGLNLLQMLLLMRARPKILLATSYEEAWEYFQRFEDNILGLISDIEFPMEGEMVPDAGIQLARKMASVRPDLSIALQSGNPKNQHLARTLGAGFLLKGSPVMLRQLQEHLTEHLFFGDFVFRLKDGTEVDRAPDLRALVKKLSTVPEESVAYHAERNDFSSWLRARAEFGLAAALRPRRIQDYPSIEALRHDLVHSIEAYRRERDRSAVADFNLEAPEGPEGLARIGGGSMGGKGRGLAFATRLLDHFRMRNRFDGVKVSVPPAVILGTDVFLEFLEENDLRHLSLETDDDDELNRRFQAARFPEEAVERLTAYLEHVSYPVAVRSSSLLEDSPFQPFAGIFDTLMLANDHPDLRVRLELLVSAIKRVYASTFSPASKAFLRATPYRLEEEQMAVIVQKLVGARQGDLFYPSVAGVARSFNFYPSHPATYEDGIVAAALGLGKTVVEGEPTYRFCPAYPEHNLEFGSVEEMVGNTQREFWALRMGDGLGGIDWRDEGRLVRVPLQQAEADGVLRWAGSTWSQENQAVYDGVSRPGVRLVTFAPILKHQLFPLAEILEALLEIGAAGTGSAVEIEFAVNLDPEPGEPMEFGFLQLRPLAGGREVDAVEFEVADPSDLICESPSVLGNGRVEAVRDLVVVDRDRFDRSRSREGAAAVARFNARLQEENRPYVLIGVGRWGSTHPSLGIPVTWDEISGAKAIVEAGFTDFRVTPSQGTHFFQNLASFNIGYFTVNADAGEGFVDWAWLAEQPAEDEEAAVRHIRLEEPIEVVMNGKSHRGVIVKPGVELL